MGISKTLMGVGLLIGATLVLGTKETQAVNSNSIVQDNIEYCIQTNKSVYDLGESIEMMYRWTNLRDSPIRFGFLRSTPCDFSIEQNGQRIWLGKGFYDYTLGGPVYTLNPSAYKEYIETCSGIDIKGDYQLKGTFIAHSINETYATPTTLSVPITIVSEPSTLSLLALGALVLKRRK